MSQTTLSPDEFRKTFAALRESLQRVIVGQSGVLEQLLVAFFAGGHVLLEGVPGLGKTLLAKSFAQTLGLSFKRIQCTPDLMPADILGTQLVVERDGRKQFEFAKGPVFTQILLADEINRATPKTQSALLEAMEEHQVTVSGTTFRLDEPFFVIATQNPIEMEGSLPLNETVLVSGRLTRGTQLLTEARQRGTPIVGDGGRAVYDLPGLWTWALSPHGQLERQPCQAYVMPYQGSLVRLKTKIGREIRVTAEHPFLVNEGGDIRWKLAKELRAGDYLVTPTSLPQPEARRELMSHEEVMEKLARRYRVVRHEELVDIATRSERFHHLERLSAGDLDALRIASRLTKTQLAQHLGLSRADYWQLVRFFRRRTANARIKSRLVRYFSAHPVDVSQVKDFVESYTITSFNRFAVTPDLAAWLGFVLSDGTVGRATVAAYQKNHPHALDAFIQTTEQQLGVPIRGIRSHPGGRTVSVGSKPLVDYLRLRFGLTRSGVIPSWMLSFPEELRRPFLRTFIGLESHCDLGRRRITFVQKRRQAVNMVMSMLLLDGIVAWARKRPDVFELKIQGEDFQAFLDRVGWVGDQRPVAARPEAPRERLPSGYRPHDYSPFRVVPVPPRDLTRICDWLGINSFHRAKDRKPLATRSWYQAYRFGRNTGIVSQAKLKHLVSDIKQEVAVRQAVDLETMASRDPWAAARLCGLSLIDVAQGASTSRHQVWKTYRAPDDAVNPAVARYIKQQFTNRIQEVERCLHRLERLSQMGYDQIEHMTTRPYAGPVFGLVVPTHQNYMAGFGACGISHNTFPLPEAQLDRFLFKIFVGYPSPEELSTILRQTTVVDTASVTTVLPREQAQAWIVAARRLVREVLVASPIEAYVVELVTATRPREDGTADSSPTRFLRYGASPRGAQAILMGAKVLALIEGRVNVSYEDVDRVLVPALNHRVVLSFEAEADKRTATDILTELTQPLRRASTSLSTPSRAPGEGRRR